MEKELEEIKELLEKYHKEVLVQLNKVLIELKDNI